MVIGVLPVCAQEMQAVQAAAAAAAQAAAEPEEDPEADILAKVSEYGRVWAAQGSTTLPGAAATTLSANALGPKCTLISSCQPIKRLLSLC